MCHGSCLCPRWRLSAFSFTNQLLHIPFPGPIGHSYLSPNQQRPDCRLFKTTIISVVWFGHTSELLGRNVRTTCPRVLHSSAQPWINMPRLYRNCFSILFQMYNALKLNWNKTISSVVGWTDTNSVSTLFVWQTPAVKLIGCQGMHYINSHEINTQRNAWWNYLSVYNGPVVSILEAGRVAAPQ